MHARPAIVVVGIVAAALYAALAIASGRDRMALDVPVLAVEAPRARALGAVLAGDRRAALTAAALAVKRDPVDARSLGLLGQAAAMAGDRATARAAFTVSQRLGWREPLTQVHWMSARLAQGDYAAAATHVDALLRQSPDLPQRALLLAPFDAAPAGRRQLAARLAASPAWDHGYFADTRSEGAGDPLARSEVAALLAARVGRRDCALVAPVLEALLRYRRDARAHALYAQHCAGKGEAAAPTDGRFVRAALVRPATILDWRFTDDGSIALDFAPAEYGGGRAVVVSAGAAMRTPFAFQTLALAPGRYRISWRERPTATGGAIAVSVACNDAERGWLAASAGRNGRTGADLVVAPGCPRQSLIFGIAGGAGQASVADVRIDPAAR